MVTRIQSLERILSKVNWRYEKAKFPFVQIYGITALVASSSYYGHTIAKGCCHIDTSLLELEDCMLDQYFAK
jgi:hypothetical protein